MLVIPRPVGSLVGEEWRVVRPCLLGAGAPERGLGRSWASFMGPRLVWKMHIQ